MHLRFRIVWVDQYGFCGRENHPHQSDIGLIVTPVKMVSEVYDEDGAFLPATDEAIAEAAKNMALDGFDPDAGSDTGTGLLQCWTCVTADGRLLDLMDFEVELVK